MSIRNPPSGMEGFYGDLINGIPPEAEWGNSVNRTLDDSISKTTTVAQSIAGALTLNGLPTLSDDWDLGANSLLVTSGGVKTITAVSLAYLVGLDQTLKQADSPTFNALKIGSLSGVIQANAGVISGDSDADDITEGSTNLFYTNDRVDSLIQNATGISWTYSGGVTLTPVLDNINLNQLLSGGIGQLIVTNSSGVPTYRTVSTATGEMGIDDGGVATVKDDSHSHNDDYYTKDEFDDFFETSVTKKKVHWNNITGKPGTYTPEVHDMISKHNDSGLITGEVIRASAPTTFGWTKLSHSDLGGITPNQHHAQSHTLQSHGTDIAYSQISNIVDITGQGSGTLLSRADHVHTDDDGSGSVNWLNLEDVPNSFNPAPHAHTWVRAFPARMLLRGTGGSIGVAEDWLQVKLSNSAGINDWVEFHLPVPYGKQVTTVWYWCWSEDPSNDIWSQIVYRYLDSGGGTITGGATAWEDDAPTTYLQMLNHSANWTATVGYTYYLRLHAENAVYDWHINQIYIEVADFNDDAP